MAIYKGFSTYNRLRKYRLTDYELCKQDLFNHFNIRKGEKLMNPDFGTIIWNVLFEPLTADIRTMIIDDVTRIVKYDPRLSVNSVILNEYGQGLQLDITLTYLTDNYTEKISMMFDRNNATVSQGIIKT